MIKQSNEKYTEKQSFRKATRTFLRDAYLDEVRRGQEIAPVHLVLEHIFFHFIYHVVSHEFYVKPLCV